MSIRLILVFFTTIICAGCDDGPGSGINLQGSPGSGQSPVDSGRGFVFGIAEKYSNKPVSIIDTTFVRSGENPRIKILHSGAAFLPFLHRSGTVAVTEPCFYNSGFVDIEYRQISALAAAGGTNPLTPCSNEIETPTGFTWIESGRLSPNGRRLAAHLHTPGEPPISVVFEDGREIVRYSGYGLPNWIDDNTLVMVGSKLVAARLGEEPVVINEEPTGPSLRTVAVSPNGSRLVFEWQSGVWIVNVNGTGLRELLPAAGYIHPTWSPDGRWVAAMQRDAPTALDAIIVGNGAVGTDFEYTNLQQLAIVQVDTGERIYADVSMVMNESQMPQGGLGWY